MVEILIATLFLVVMLSPWIYVAQKTSGAKIPFWFVGVAALFLAAVLQRMFGVDAARHIGYYGAIVLGLGIVAASFVWFSGRSK